ncbi:unnamed protein product [Prunus brigantina]
MERALTLVGARLVLRTMVGVFWLVRLNILATLARRSSTSAWRLSPTNDGAKLLMLFLGEGQLRDRGLSLAKEGHGPSIKGEPAEDKTGEAVVKLRTPVWCRPKALRCLSQLGIVTFKGGGLHKVPMWDFVQVAVLMTRVSCF